MRKAFMKHNEKQNLTYIYDTVKRCQMPKYKAFTIKSDYQNE